ncbi:MAG: sulfotransferase domain-containing protein [Bacteroidetes bacterium]|nr:sulfotransferase domain-containing protein [Bacteroidota bacterium]
MRRYLRKLVGEDIFLYNLWFKIVSRNNPRKKRKVFTKDTVCYIGGYQRSGNTYLAHIVNHVFPDLVYVSHLHKVAVVKYSLKLGIPAFVLIRKPIDAISSNYLKHYSATRDTIPEEINFQLLRKYTEEYLWYYQVIYELRSKVAIIRFEDMITNTLQVLNRLAHLSKAKLTNEEMLGRSQTAKQSYQGATDKLGSSKPSKYKEKSKNKVKESLVKLKLFNEADEVYKGILENLK